MKMTRERYLNRRDLLGCKTKPHPESVVFQGIQSVTIGSLVGIIVLASLMTVGLGQ